MTNFNSNLKNLTSRDLRSLFPIFSLRARGDLALSYLDSAATAQRPAVVIDAVSTFYSRNNANIHRGAYELSATATSQYENAREKVARFIGARSSRSVVFTRGTTDALNMAAYLLEPRINSGDTILLSLLEHHSNIVPWQLLAKRRGARIIWSEVSADGIFDLDDFSAKVHSAKPKIVALTTLSNAIGTVVPYLECAALAREQGALVVLDAAQAVAHEPLHVADLACDMLAFSGHKLYGPTGVGVLYAREELLEKLEPVVGGGGMISTVTTEGSSWAEIPYRFEAGTPAIAEVIGLGAAIDFVSQIGLKRIAVLEAQVLDRLLEALAEEGGVRVLGPASTGKRSLQRAICSFVIPGVHPHDVATIADSLNVQVRAGHHCAMPLLARLGVESTVRASVGFYNDTADVEVLLEAVRRAKKRFVG